MKIGGYDIQKGSLVFVNQMYMNFQINDPHSFKPERYLFKTTTTEHKQYINNHLFSLFIIIFKIDLVKILQNYLKQNQSEFHLNQELQIIYFVLLEHQ